MNNLAQAEGSVHPASLLLPQLIRKRAEAEPDRVFLLQRGGSPVTYGDLHADAGRWAAALTSCDVSPDDNVLVLLPAGATAVGVWLGLSWIQAVEVPVNTAYFGRSLTHVVQNSRAKVIVIAERFLNRLQDLGGELGDLKLALVIGESATARELAIDVQQASRLLSEAAEINLGAGPRRDHIATIVYTSGTSGPSKGVVLPWGALQATATGIMPLASMTPDDCYYCPFPLYNNAGKFPIFMMAILNGRVLLREPWKTDEFWDDVDRFGCTTTLLFAAMANFLLKAEARADDAKHALRNVLMVPLLRDTATFIERFHVRVCTTFGATEIGNPIVSPGWNSASLSCGRLRPEYEARIVDANDEPLGPNQVGELAVRAARPWTTMAGYWAMPEATLEATRNQWVHTGDNLMRDDDGEYFFVDRKKDAIRRRGANISSQEVEHEVSQHPAILECAAVAVPSEYGEDDVKIVVALRPDFALEPSALLEFLLPRMPHFMVPRYVEFVAELPKSETQKVRKSELTAVTAGTWDREAAGFDVRRSK
jgi:crotonobetaine/carnitine-CoA ligase